jgi:hypothetical protein
VSEETVEILVGSYSRAELDGMAEALGLNSADYPNKISIAEAILKTREEQREREWIEREREARIQELKKKMTEDTVKGKIAAIKVTAGNMQKSVKALQSEVKERARAYRVFAKELQSLVAAMQTSIMEQVNENQEYVKEFYGLVAAMQTSIMEQVNENQEYVKEFYG